MRQKQLHKIIALTLAILVFFSTTGVGIALGWCHCTNQTVASIFVPSDCCDHQVAKSTKDTCCSKTTAIINTNKVSVKAQKCCDTVYKYTNAGIDFTNWIEAEWPTITWVQWSTTLAANSTMIGTASCLPKPSVSKANPNKAPPRLFGKKLLQFIQIYRC